MESGKMITLKTSDGEEFVVEEKIVKESQTILHMIEDDCPQSTIPLPNVTAKIFARVIEYCKKHVETSEYKELKVWDEEFVKVEQDELFDLILAANYLNIAGLLGLTCKTVADMIKGKTPEEIRKHFNIKNDLTPKKKRRSAMRTNGLLNKLVFSNLDPQALTNFVHL